MFTVSMPENFEDQVSTLYTFPAKLTFTANLTVPARGVRLVGNLANETVAKVASGVTIIASAAGGAWLMNKLAPGTPSASIGLVAGGIFGCLAAVMLRVNELKISGLGIAAEMKLEAIAKDAREAKQVARLAVEAALMLAHRPSGKMGGGSWEETDAIRNRLAMRMKELGFSRQEGSRLAEVDDPFIAARIVNGIVVDRLVQYDNEVGKKHGGIGHTLATHLMTKRRTNENYAPTHAELLKMIGEDAAKSPLVAPSLAFYKQWEDSDARFYFTVENLETLNQLRQ